MKNLFKKLALVSSLVMAGLVAGEASAATVVGNVTVTGTAVNACTISSPAVNAGAILGTDFTSFGAFAVTPFNLAVQCDNTVPYSIASPATAPFVSFGGVASVSTVSISSTPNAIGDISVFPVIGTGTGASQSIPLNVIFTGNSNAIPALGAITATVPLTMTY